MNKRFGSLLQGELQRYTKYNITTISFIVAVIWFFVLYFIEDATLFQQLLPMIVMTDATLLSILYIGSLMFFEKSESTISTLLVTPVSRRELILSKVLANTIHTTIASSVIVAVFFFVKGVDVHWGYLLISLVMSVFFHSLLGMAFSYQSKSFTSMLVNVMIYALVLTIPTLLFEFQLLKGVAWEWGLKLIPTQQAMILIQSAFSPSVSFSDWVIAVGYFMIVGFVGYRFYIEPQFHDYAIKQSGV